MIAKELHKKIYNSAVELLERQPRTREALIDAILKNAKFSAEELADTSLNSAKNVYRSRAGTVLTEMLKDGAIIEENDGIYRLAYDKPVAIRIERCEREILRILTKAPTSRRAIRDELTRIFGTDKTPTRRDDGKLADFISKTLKRLIEATVINFDGTKYSLSEKAVARADDINAILSLKSEFLSRLHSKGGEFFEHYFMNLLSKYLAKHGKAVTECTVSGGSDDGGIDGIAKTVDALGFRETVMVQTKNRNVVISETDVRGFYGAVCAYRGTRGIFATTSFFHSGAKDFLNAIDECVGVDGDKIFSMACECLYGIVKSKGKLMLDSKII